MISFTTALSDLAVKSSVLVTAVSPGPVQTERRDNLMRQQVQAAGQDPAVYVKERSQQFPLGRAPAGGGRGRLLPRLRARLLSHHGGRRDH